MEDSEAIAFHRPLSEHSMECRYRIYPPTHPSIHSIKFNLIDAELHVSVFLYVPDINFTNTLTDLISKYYFKFCSFALFFLSNLLLNIFMAMHSTISAKISYQRSLFLHHFIFISNIITYHTLLSLSNFSSHCTLANLLFLFFKYLVIIFLIKMNIR